MRRFLSLSLLLFSLLCRAPAETAPTDSHESFPTNEQLRHYRSLGNARLSPDGKRVLVAVKEATADGAKSHLWLSGISDEAPRQLTYSPDADKGGEHDGEWMPDGDSILFLGKRGERTSLYRLPMTGGEASPFVLKVKPVVDESKLADALPLKEKAADPAKEPSGGAAEGKNDDKKATAAATDEVTLSVARYFVSPDGKRIAVVADDPETPGEKAQKEAKADASWVDHDPHGSRLYLLDVATGKLTPVGLAPDVRSAAWSADSNRLFVLAEGMNSAGDLGPARSGSLVTVADPSHAEKLSDLPGTIAAAAWSLDGRSIAYLAQSERDAPPGYSDLFLYDLATKKSHNLSGGLEGSLRGAAPISLADGSIVEQAEFGFRGKLVRYSPGVKGPEVLGLAPADVSGVSTNASRGGWLFTGSGGGKAQALYFAADLKAEAKLVKIPALAPEGMRVVAPKRVSWKSDGFQIEGRLYLPPDASEGKVPLIVEVHGGPLGAYSDAHAPWIEFLLGQGWAVLRTNPRGSSGYGAAFAAANKNDLGGGDYRDIMAGVDAVIASEPIDSSRMALMGYSYGGEMAAFVEGKTTRFKAIVSGAPVIDQYSEYGTEDASWYDRWYFGKPWEHPEDAWRQSPLAGAGKAKTPFLLLQGESDSTDPPGQSQEMYRALRQMGVPVDLVTYPRDNHGPLAMALYGYPVGEPWHGYDARRRVIGFIHAAFQAGNR